MTEELLQQAIAAGRAGNRPETKRLLLQAIQQDSGSAHAWYLLSQVVDQPDQAIECLQRVLELAPGNVQAQQRMQKLLDAKQRDVAGYRPSGVPPEEQGTVLQAALAPIAPQPIPEPVRSEAIPWSKVLLLGTCLFSLVFCVGVAVLLGLAFRSETIAKAGDDEQATQPPQQNRARPQATQQPKQNRARSPVAVGASAPDFSLPDAYSKKDVQLSQFTGQPVLLNFWATWCGYCIEEMPAIESVYQKYQSQGLVVLAVDVNESSSKVTKAGDRLGLSFSLLLDSEGDISIMYRVTAFPTSYFIDRDGTIQRVHTGTMDEAQLEKYIGEIMQ